MLNYDPDDIPDFDEDACNEATSIGLQPIHVICDVPNCETGEYKGVSFTAYVSFVPRIGDRIGLQDGKQCEVRRVYHKVVKPGKFFSMIPNVYAITLGNKSDDED